MIPVFFFGRRAAIPALRWFSVLLGVLAVGVAWGQEPVPLTPDDTATWNPDGAVLPHIFLENLCDVGHIFLDSQLGPPSAPRVGPIFGDLTADALGRSLAPGWQAAGGSRLADQLAAGLAYGPSVAGGRGDGVVAGKVIAADLGPVLESPGGALYGVPTPIPEPGVAALLVAGLALVGRRGWRPARS